MKKRIENHMELLLLENEDISKGHKSYITHLCVKIRSTKKELFLELFPVF